MRSQVCAGYLGAVSDDTWAGLADQFVDGAYASVKGHVRTYVMHQQLLEHLPRLRRRCSTSAAGPATSRFPLAQAGYDVTLLDPSAAMLDKARSDSSGCPPRPSGGSAWCRPTVSTPSRPSTVGASPPCCATACSGTSSNRSPWSTSCAGAPPPAAWSRS